MKLVNYLYNLENILYLTKIELTFCIAYFIVALIICAYSVPGGSLFSVDSTSYISVAENLYNTHNLLLVRGPLIYPALIAIGMGLGLTSEHSAAIIPIICYSLLGFPIFLLGKIVSRPIIGYITCLICLLCGNYLLMISTSAWTDMPYLFFSALAMLFLAIYNKYRNLSSVVLAGTFILLASLTRYIGITLFITGIIIIIMNKIELKRLLISLISFCLVSIIPFIIWIFSTPKLYTLTASSRNPSIDVRMYQFLICLDQIFYRDYGIIIAIIILIFLLAILNIYSNKNLSIFIKNTFPLICYISIYSVLLIIMTSSFWISLSYCSMQTRYVVQIFPYVVLLMASSFSYVYNKNYATSILFKILSIFLCILLLAQGANSLYFMANQIRLKSIPNYSDREGLSLYISEYNITQKDRIYCEGIHDWSNLDMELHKKYPNIDLGYIYNNKPGATIFDNLTVTWGVPSSAESLLELIKENNNSTYIIISYELSQEYLKHPPRDIYLSNPYKLSKSIIYKTDLRDNESCSQDAYVINSAPSMHIPLIGDFKDLGHDQLLLLGRNFTNTRNNHSYFDIWDFCNVHAEKRVRIEGLDKTGILAYPWKSNDTPLSGDFMNLGYSQALFVDSNPKGYRIHIEDFSKDEPSIITRYAGFLYGNSSPKDLIDSKHAKLVGDFLGLGYDQVLFIDRSSDGGKLAISDFSKGTPPMIIEFPKIWEDPHLYDLWLDDHDIQIAGDFMGLGHSQVLFVNCNRTNAEKEKIMIMDFSNSKSPGSIRYLENWGGGLFNEWLDTNDTQLVGDFMNQGHSQVLFINHLQKGRKIMIVDFSQGKPPATADYVKYRENWEKGAIFQGWLDINDTQVVGDFMSLGYDQLVFLNSSLNAKKITIVDFTKGIPIAL